MGYFLAVFYKVARRLLEENVRITANLDGERTEYLGVEPPVC